MNYHLYDIFSEIFSSLNRSEQSLILERLILTLGIITYCASKYRQQQCILIYMYFYRNKLNIKIFL